MAVRAYGVIESQVVGAARGAAVTAAGDASSGGSKHYT